MLSIDKELISRCKKADRVSQKLLFERVYALMFRLCFRYLASQADAEDCLMRGMMKSFQHIDDFKFQGDYSFYAWLKKIMVNEALMEIRKKNNLLLVPQESAVEIADGHDIISQLSAEAIYKLIADLPTGYRTVFNLYVVEGHPHAEIAEMLGISENTSRSQLAKARNRLKTIINEEGEAYGT